MYVGLGANLGDRAKNLAAARRALSSLGTHFAASPIYETEPWGVDDPQPWYLNQVCRFETTLPPDELVRRLLRIEEQLGRVRNAVNAARIIDLDLLLYDDVVLNEPRVTVPHPRMHERAFVLAPLTKLAPGARHPVLHETVARLLSRVDKSGVRVWRDT